MDYEINHWPSSRRCGYIFYSEYTLSSWLYYVAGNNGGNNMGAGPMEKRCNCPLKNGPYNYTDSGTQRHSSIYAAICIASGSDIYELVSSYASWAAANTCPKGWGRSGAFVSSDSDYVRQAQGYVVDGEQGDPIYGYVTRYRDVYYDYLTTRIAKI